MNVSRILVSYGVFLFVAGFIGFAAAGFDARAKTAIIMGTACGGLMALIGLLARARGGAKARTMGWLGVFFACFFLATFTWRASIAWGNLPEKLYVAVLLTTMALASIVTAGLLIRTLRSATVAIRA